MSKYLSLDYKTLNKLVAKSGTAISEIYEGVILLYHHIDIETLLIILINKSLFIKQTMIRTKIYTYLDFIILKKKLYFLIKHWDEVEDIEYLENIIYETNLPFLSDEMRRYYIIKPHLYDKTETLHSLRSKYKTDYGFLYYLNPRYTRLYKKLGTILVSIVNHNFKIMLIPNPEEFKKLFNEESQAIFQKYNQYTEFKFIDIGDYVVIPPELEYLFK